MVLQSTKPELIGTRSGYVIRFTCPDCHTENSIVYSMPKKYFLETRDASCAKCRKRYTIRVPGEKHAGIASPV
ncbi:MAG: hypothetical protein ABFC24_00290 [Methanoregulaceae archaeon]